MKVIGFAGAIGSGKSTASSILVEHGFTEYSFAKPLKEIAKILGFEHYEVYGTQQEKEASSKEWGISGRKFLQIFGTEICRETLPSHFPEMKQVWIRLFEKFVRECSPTVVHLKRSRGVVIQDCDIYIGRRINMGGWSLPESKWANPFKVNTPTDLPESLRLYEQHVRSNPDMISCLHQLSGKRLGCWCAPNACHGDVLVKLFNERGVVVGDVRTPEEVEAIHRLGGKVYRIERGTASALTSTCHSSEAHAHSLGDGVIYNNGSLDDFRSVVMQTVGLIDSHRGVVNPELCCSSE